MNCRHCASPLSIQLIDLGAAPPSNAFNASQDAAEAHYPLRVLICMQCGLAQTDITLFKLDHDELFTDDYPYHSSTSHSWVQHARRFVERITEELKLGTDSLTIEVGCNDGYLLQWMTTPCYGIEPTATGRKALAKGIEIARAFFGQKMAERLPRQADLMICNNVLAHVPDINDFVRGFSTLLKPDGIAVFEFPSLIETIRRNQFDQVYAEHYSMLSLTAASNVFRRNGLRIYDAESLETHGGSLRIFAQRDDTGQRESSKNLVHLLLDEWPLAYPAFFADFQKQADRVKNDLTQFLLNAKQANQTVAGFGAAAKANTLLNYAGIRADLLPYIVDDTPAKQGKFCPGSRIPVRPNFADKPDYVIVFPYNWRQEIIKKLSPMGSKLVFAIPQLEIVDVTSMRAAA